MPKLAGKILIILLVASVGLAALNMQICTWANAGRSLKDHVCLNKCPAHSSASMFAKLQFAVIGVTVIMLFALHTQPLRLASSYEPSQWEATPPYHPPRAYA